MSNIVTVDFQGDTLFAFEQGGTPFIAIGPICDALGINTRRQRERIKDDPILSEGCTVAVLPSAGGPQDTFCLRLDLVHGWLFTIDESRVNEAARPRVVYYKRQCYAALFQHFYGSRSPGNRSALTPLAPADETAFVKRSLVNEARMTFGPAAARELWRELGLPITPAMNTNQRQGALQLEGGR